MFPVDIIVQISETLINLVPQSYNFSHPTLNPLVEEDSNPITTSLFVVRHRNNKPVLEIAATWRNLCNICKEVNSKLKLINAKDGLIIKEEWDDELYYTLPNGVPHGPYISKSMEGMYNNGVKHGIWKVHEFSFYSRLENRIVPPRHYVINYKNGKPEGLYESCEKYEEMDCKLNIEKGYFVNGVMSGKWRFSSCIVELKDNTCVGLHDVLINITYSERDIIDNINRKIPLMLQKLL